MRCQMCRNILFIFSRTSFSPRWCEYWDLGTWSYCSETFVEQFIHVVVHVLVVFVFWRKLKIISSLLCSACHYLFDQNKCKCLAYEAFQDVLVLHYKSQVLNFVSCKAEEVQIILPKEPSERYFLSFSYVFQIWPKCQITLVVMGQIWYADL